MAFDVKNTPSQVVQRDIYAFDPATFVLVDTVRPDSKNVEARESLYQQLGVTDPEQAVTVRTGYYPNAKADDGKGRTNYSLRLNFVTVDDEAVLLPDKGISHDSIVVALNLGGTKGIRDLSAITRMVHAAFAFLAPSTLLDTVGEDVLLKMGYGVTSELLEADPNFQA